MIDRTVLKYLLDITQSYKTCDFRLREKDGREQFILELEDGNIKIMPDYHNNDCYLLTINIGDGDTSQYLNISELNAFLHVLKNRIAYYKIYKDCHNFFSKALKETCYLNYGKLI